MKILIEVEAPGWDGSCPGEPDMDVEVAAFVSRLVESRIHRKATVTLSIVGNGYVLVDAEALVRLQQKAGLRE